MKGEVVYTWSKWSARDMTANLTEQCHTPAPNQWHPLITQSLPDHC